MPVTQASLVQEHGTWLQGCSDNHFLPLGFYSVALLSFLLWKIYFKWGLRFKALGHLHVTCDSRRCDGRVQVRRGGKTEAGIVPQASPWPELHCQGLGPLQLHRASSVVVKNPCKP
jgi:hypothetical protein